MRIIFAGTPSFAARALIALLSSEHQILLALTQPDRPAGRGMKIQVSDVKKVAEAHAIPLLQPLTLKSVAIHTQLRKFDADIMIVAAYGLILPLEVLKIPRYGCLNIHASLLPRWRGAAPIQRAILAGDQETGITIMQMDQGLDTGLMLLQHTLPIGPRDTSQTLHDKLADLGAKSIVEALDLLRLEKLSATPQDETQACYASKIQKIEAEIDWRLDANQIDRCVRAFNPFPGAYTYFQGELLKIWQARAITASGQAGKIITIGSEGVTVGCGRGALILEIVQKSGGKKMPVAEFLAGQSLEVGQYFSAARIAGSVND